MGAGGPLHRRGDRARAPFRTGREQDQQAAQRLLARVDRDTIDEHTFIAWAEATHAAARVVWYARPANDVLDDRYLKDVLPILDRQLGLAGLRLARFLNQAYGSDVCPVK